MKLVTGTNSNVAVVSARFPQDVTERRTDTRQTNRMLVRRGQPGRSRLSKPAHPGAVQKWSPHKFGMNANLSSHFEHKVGYNAKPTEMYRRCQFHVESKLILDVSIMLRMGTTVVNASHTSPPVRLHAEASRVAAPGLGS